MLAWSRCGGVKWAHPTSVSNALGLCRFCCYCGNSAAKREGLLVVRCFTGSRNVGGEEEKRDDASLTSDDWLFSR